MSARKMLADSTQDTFGRKRKKDAIAKARKKKTEKRRKSEEPEDDELLDLNINLLPISGYIRNPDQMLDHVFKSVRGDTFSGMLPPILKNVPEEELRELCLAELEVMSKKRVKRIISGEDPDDISSSDSDDDFDSEEEAQKEEVAEEAEEESTGELVDISDDEEECESVHSNDDDTSDVSQDDNDGLDDVSSVESPTDFRDEIEAPVVDNQNVSEDDDEDDYLEIKPRQQMVDMEDGEVMSSGDENENCDPTWRTRGEEAVERRSKELEDQAKEAEDVEMPEMVETVTEPAETALPIASAGTDLNPSSDCDGDRGERESNSCDDTGLQEVVKETSKDNAKNAVEMEPESVIEPADHSVVKGEPSDGEVAAVVLSTSDVLENSVNLHADNELEAVTGSAVKEELTSVPGCSEISLQDKVDIPASDVSAEDIFAALNRSCSEEEIAESVEIVETQQNVKTSDDVCETSEVGGQKTSMVKGTDSKTSLFRTRKIHGKHRTKHTDNDDSDSNNQSSCDVQVKDSSTSNDGGTAMRKDSETVSADTGARHVMFDESKNIVHSLTKERKKTSKKKMQKAVHSDNVEESAVEVAAVTEEGSQDVVVVADNAEDMSEFERLCGGTSSKRSQSPDSESQSAEQTDKPNSLEILELEMRARVIRAMLKAQEKDKK